MIDGYMAGWAVVLCLTPTIAGAMLWYGYEWGKKDGLDEGRRIARRQVVDAQMKMGERSARITRELHDRIRELESTP